MRTLLPCLVLVACTHSAPMSSGPDHGLCDSYLTCVAEATPAALAALQQGYGEGGSCWANEVDAANCRTACANALLALRQSASCSCQSSAECVDSGQPLCESGLCVASCGQLLSCIDGCVDDSCIDKCRGRSTVDDYLKYKAIDRCYTDACYGGSLTTGDGPCSGGTTPQCQNCLDVTAPQRCASQIQACGDDA